jgi:AcrR family transcriptional regulator
MPAPLISREEVAERLTRAFRRYGYDAASLAQLCEATGLVRASLYHYFPGGKEEMARAAHAHAGRKVHELIITPLLAAGTPAERLARAAEGLAEFYANGSEACLTALFSQGSARGLFSEQVRGSIARLTGALACAAVDSGVPEDIAADRAEDAVGRVQGGLILAEATGDPSVFQRALRRIGRDLLSPVK